MLVNPLLMEIGFFQSHKKSIWGPTHRRTDVRHSGKVYWVKQSIFPSCLVSHPRPGAQLHPYLWKHKPTSLPFRPREPVLEMQNISDFHLHITARLRAWTCTWALVSARPTWLLQRESARIHQLPKAKSKEPSPPIKLWWYLPGFGKG